MLELMGSYLLLLIGILLILILLILINFRNKSNARIQRVLLEASLAELQKQTEILQKLDRKAGLENTESKQENPLDKSENLYPKFSAER